MSIHNLHDYPDSPDDERVIPGGLRGFANLNGISLETARRIIARGEVEVVDLSPRRKGVTYGASRRYRAARTRTA